MVKSKRNITSTTRLPKKQKYSIIIPAAGQGYRMKSYGPKCLIKLQDNETTILEHQLAMIGKAFKQCEIILVTGFERDRVCRQSPGHLIKPENEDFATTNVIKSIGIGLQHVTTDNVVVIHGDLVFNKFTLKVPFHEESMLILDGEDGYMDSGEVGCITNAGQAESLMYDLPHKWAQIAFFTGRELEVLRQICSNDSYSMYFSFEAINEIINHGGVFRTVSPKNMAITDVDTSKDIIKARNIYENCCK